MSRRPKKLPLRPACEVLEFRRLFTVPTVSISATPAAVPHSPGNPTQPFVSSSSFTVTRTGATGSSLTVALKVSGSAVVGVDYGFPVNLQGGTDGNYTRTIGANDTQAGFAALVINDSGNPRGTRQIDVQIVAPPSGFAPYTSTGGPADVTLYDQTTNTNKPKNDPQSTGVNTPTSNIGPVSTGLTDGNASTQVPGAAGDPCDCGCGCYDPPTPTYQSDDPHPIVTADVYLPADPAAYRYHATLSLNGSLQASAYYQVPSNPSGGVFRFALQVDAGSLPTGRYADLITVTPVYFNQQEGQPVAVEPGFATIVNEADSDYGAAQSLSNVQQLYPASDGSGITWVRPDGSYSWFAKTGSTYAAADGSYATLTAGTVGTTLTYTVAEPDGLLYRFYSSGANTGRLYEKDNRQGLSTTYTYTTAGDLATFTDPFGRTTTYTYSTHTATGASHTLLDSATDFAGRVTSYSYSYLPTFGSGHWVLTAATQPDPDGAGSLVAPVTAYGYNAVTGQMTSVSEPAGIATPVGRVTTIVYDFAQRVRQVIRPGDSAASILTEITTIIPADEAGLIDPTSGLGALTNPGAAPPSSSNVFASVQRSYTTSGGTTTQPGLWKTYVDTNGNSAKVVDPLGLTTLYVRNASGQGTQVYESDGATVLRTTSFTYDASGNLTGVTYGDGSTASWSNYNAFGEPGSYTDGNGHTTTFAYYADGDLQTVQEPIDVARTRTTTYTYDLKGRIASVTVPAIGTGSTTTTYTYYGATKHYKLQQITNPDGSIEAFNYDSADNLVTAQDEMGRITAYGYDNLGRLTSVTEPDPDGAGILTSPVIGYSYDASGEVIGVTVPTPRTGSTGTVTTSYTYDGQGRLKSVVLPDPNGTAGAGPATVYTYDGYGNLATVTDPLLHVTTYTYDGDDRLTSVTEPDPDGAGILTSPVIGYAYDGLSRVVSVTDPLLRVTSYGYDALDRVTTVSSTGPLNPGVYATTVYTYDGNGNIKTVTDANGHTTTFTYDWADELVQVTQPTDGSGHTPVTTYVYDILGHLSQAINPDNEATDYTYNSRGWLTKVQLPSPDGTAPRPTTSYTYDADGELTQVTTPNGNALGTPGPYTTTYVYDNLGRVINVLQPAPNSNVGTVAPVTTYAYDALGDLTKVINPDNNTTTYTYDALGRIASVIRPAPSGTGAGPTTAYLYDADGNVTRVTDPMGHAVSYTYDGLNRPIKVAQLNPNGDTSPGASLTTTYKYDADGELISVTDPVANAGGSWGGTTTYTYDDLGRRTSTIVSTAANPSTTTSVGYDPAGRVTKVTDPDGNVTSYTYDDADRLTQVTDPFGALTTYTYDPAGRLIKKTDPVLVAGSPRVTTYVYDHDGRLTSVKAPAAGSTSATVLETLSYTYDADGNRLSAIDTSTISGAPSTVTETFAYDRLDRQIAESVAVQYGSLNLPAFIVASSLDAAGRLVGTSDSQGVATTYYRDSLGRLTNIISTAGSAQAAFAYNADSQVTLEIRNIGVGANIATTYAYDVFNRLSGQTDVSSQTGTLLQAGYALDGDNHVIARTLNYDYSGSVLIAVSRSYSYDKSGQMTGTTGSGDFAPSTTTYTYDAAGNQHASSVTHNRVTSDGAYTYTYDNVGELSKKTAGNGNYTNYVYDAFGRLVNATNYNASSQVLSGETYLYDALGRRVVIVGAATVTSTAYLGSTPYADLVGTSSPALSLRYLSGDAVDALLGQVAASGTVAWYLTDSQGTVDEVVTNAGAYVDSVVYDPFGSITAESAASAGTRFKYAGGAYSTVSGLTQFGARYYDGSQGRWISQDPIGFAGGDANLYRYVGNDPVGYVDPSGLYGDPANATSPALAFQDSLFDNTFGLFFGGLNALGKAFIGDPAQKATDLVNLGPNIDKDSAKQYTPFDQLDPANGPLTAGSIRPGGYPYSQDTANGLQVAGEMGMAGTSPFMPSITPMMRPMLPGPGPVGQKALPVPKNAPIRPVSRESIINSMGKGCFQDKINAGRDLIRRAKAADPGFLSQEARSVKGDFLFIGSGSRPGLKNVLVIQPNGCVRRMEFDPSKIQPIPGGKIFRVDLSGSELLVPGD